MAMSPRDMLQSTGAPRVLPLHGHAACCRALSACLPAQLPPW